MAVELAINQRNKVGVGFRPAQAELLQEEGATDRFEVMGVRREAAALR